ncbi:MAG TPA: hypothetical protein VF026_16255 [Ktedonobacteraceae bacterium]
MQMNKIARSPCNVLIPHLCAPALHASALDTPLHTRARGCGNDFAAHPLQEAVLEMEEERDQLPDGSDECHRENLDKYSMAAYNISK